MKLARYRRDGRALPGLVDSDGTVRDLSGVVADIDGATLAPDALARIAALDPAGLPVVPGPVDLAPPLAVPGKIVGIGLNYSDHAAEAGMAVPTEPILFLKAPSSLCGPQDTVLLPAWAERADWEVELGVVIGSLAHDVAEDRALDHVAGYCVVNDISERGWQIDRGGQWTKGKSADTFCPVGPWIVTRDEVPDPQALDLWLDLDGARQQEGSTATMVFGVAHLVSYISRFMTLHPGDLITTGTPPGVGWGRKPPRYLQPGQVMTLGIEGLGTQRLPVARR